MKIKISIEYKIQKQTLDAYENLYLTTRAFLDLIEFVGDDETIVNTDNLDDLNSAYQGVFRIKNNQEV